MGRHSLPDGHRTAASDPRPRGRGRAVALVTALVLVVAAGAAVAVRAGFLPLGASCRDDAVRLDVAAAPSVTPALKDAADHVRDRDITSDGHCMDIRVAAREPYEVADEIRRDSAKATYDVWVPDSQVWVQRAGIGGNQARVSPAGNVASSPIGVGMLESAARELGWPRKTYTWSRLAGVPAREDAPRLGAADPARSASGLLALTRLGASARASGAEDADTRAAATAKALASRTSDSDSGLLDTLARDSSGAERGSPRRNEALILSEQASFTHNASADEEHELDLFYPKDGSPALDYPYTLIRENDLSTDESRAALRFMAFFGERAGLRILAEHGFRTTDGARPSAELVTAAGGRTPQPYAREPDEAPSDKDVQEALGMWTITVQSARLITVVDASDSMRRLVPGRGESRMDVTKAALLQALAGFTDDDEIGLWEFAARLDGARDHRELVPTGRLGDRKGDGTQRDRLTKAFGALRPVPGGATGLYDTTLAAYEKAHEGYAPGRFNTLVLLTDGVNQDPGSISRSGLISRLRALADPEEPLPIIAIAVGPDADEREADQIARATGGSGHEVDDPAQIHSVILKAIVQAGARQ
ncbi:substrate-binding domain-containing protein [Streptomyces sp. LNU-CPARS28]|uniref:substrate-binding domain-containing protein n=1 Tax=Streptomyces sp. LNU-CPARS28 TaxID=3137371 RepID=UPI0031367CF7